MYGFFVEVFSRMRKFLQIAPYLLVVLLLLTNLALVWQNISLKRVLDASAPRKIASGDYLVDFVSTLPDGSGKGIRFSEAEVKHVLFFFRSDCKFCHAQVPLWKELHRRLDPNKYSVVLVTPESNSSEVHEFLSSNSIENWKVVHVGLNDLVEARINETPTTVVVNQRSLVEQVWVGRWNTEQIDAVEKAFSIDLPEI